MWLELEAILLGHNACPRVCSFRSARMGCWWKTWTAARSPRRGFCAAAAARRRGSPFWWSMGRCLRSNPGASTDPSTFRSSFSLRTAPAGLPIGCGRAFALSLEALSMLSLPPLAPRPTPLACVLFRPHRFNVCVAFAWLRQVAAGGNASYFYPWIKSVAGSKEELKCSGRGTCDRRNALLQGAGLCTCFHAFEASDKRGQEGFEPDCG